VHLPNLKTKINTLEDKKTKKTKVLLCVGISLEQKQMMSDCSVALKRERHVWRPGIHYFIILATL